MPSQPPLCEKTLLVFLPLPVRIQLYGVRCHPTTSFSLNYNYCFTGSISNIVTLGVRDSTYEFKTQFRPLLHMIFLSRDLSEVKEELCAYLEEQSSRQKEQKGLNSRNGNILGGA